MCACACSSAARAKRWPAAMGACAAVAAGIRLGLLDHEVHVDMRGGRLTIAWTGQDTDTLYMTGPATTVFEGQIDIPDHR